MSKGMNWSRVNDRNRMWRHGVEDVKESFVNPLPKKRPRRPVSKSEQRAEAAKAFTEWRTRHGSK